jgi:hypothetical protein
MKKFIILFLFTLFIFSSLLFAEVIHSIPKDGFVPNEITAIRIAEAVWLPIFGEEIYKDKPFKAVLKDGIWIVNGTLSEDTLGGTATAEITKQDGRILAVYHTQ